MQQIARRFMNARPPEHGRIRFGERFKSGGRERPRALKTWRFTSPDEIAIRQIAQEYGGEARPWFDPKANPQNQWEVLTPVDRIHVWLPTEDSLSIMMEQWGGRGIERRCDEVTCTFYGRGRPMQAPCYCADQPKPTCKPYSRLNVIIPNVVFGGVWRLEVKGNHFAHEAPGMISTIASLQERQGMVRVDLLLTERTGKDDEGRMTKFIVPKISVAMTPQQMLEGMAQVQRLAIGPSREVTETPVATPELRSVTVDPDDDDIVDAEILEGPWHHAIDEDDTELTQLLKQSVEQAEIRKAHREDGWDEPPGHVAVKRNPDPNGPKYIRK